MRSRGFSYTELLVGIALAGLLGTAVYGILRSTVRVSATQSETSEFQGQLALALDSLRHELQETDIGLIRLGFSPFAVTTDSNGNEILEIKVPPRDRRTLAFENDIYIQERSGWAWTNTTYTPYSSNRHMFTIAPTWGAWCGKITPRLDQWIATEDTGSYWYGGKTLFIGPGFWLLTHFNPAVAGSVNGCHETNGLSDGASLSSVIQDEYPKKITTRSRYISAGTLLGVPIKSKQIGMTYNTSGTQTLKTGSVIVTDSWNIYPVNTSAVPAKSLAFTFDVKGAEKKLSAVATADLKNISAVNVKIGATLEKKDVSGVLKTVDIPVTLKVKFKNSILDQNTTPKIEDKREFTPELSTIASRGMGQPAVEDIGGTTYVYVPTIAWNATFANSLGYITVIDPADGSVKADIPLIWDSDPGAGVANVNFLPSKAVLTSAGLIVGGYTIAGGVRQAVIFQVARIGNLATNRINWAATPQFVRFGDANGTVHGCSLASHTYYMADTMNIAASGNTIYWGSFTRTDARTVFDIYNRVQIYRTSIDWTATPPTATAAWGANAPALSTEWTPIHERRGGTEGRTYFLLGAMALNPAGDRLVMCEDSTDRNYNWWDNQGGLYSAKPTTATPTAETGDPIAANWSDKVTTAEFMMMGDFRNLTLYSFTIRGSCSGMDINAEGDVYLSGPVNLNMWPAPYMLTRGYIYEPIILTPSNSTRTAYVGKTDLDNEYLSQEAEDDGFTAYSLSNLGGFGILQSTGDLYYGTITSPGLTPTTKIGKFRYTPLTPGVGFSSEASSVPYLSQLNATSVTTTARKPGRIPAVGTLLPETSYNASSGTYDHDPLHCRRFVTVDSWDDCVKKKLGGLAR